LPLFPINVNRCVSSLLFEELYSSGVLFSAAFRRSDILERWEFRSERARRKETRLKSRDRARITRLSLIFWHFTRALRLR